MLARTARQTARTARPVIRPGQKASIARRSYAVKAHESGPYERSANANSVAVAGGVVAAMLLAGYLMGIAGDHSKRDAAIKQVQAMPESQSTGSAGKVIDSAKALPDKLPKTVEEAKAIPKKVAKAQEATSALPSAVSEKADEAKSAVKKVAKKAGDKVDEAKSALPSAVSEKVDDAKAAVKKVASKAGDAKAAVKKEVSNKAEEAKELPKVVAKKADEAAESMPSSSSTKSSPSSDPSVSSTGASVPLAGLGEGEESIPSAEEDGDPQSAAFNPETGEINWDCPCLGGMAHGVCGEDFKAAFSCFVYSQEEPKGGDCIDKFRAMQDCFRAHPEIYGEAGEDDEDEPSSPSSRSEESEYDIISEVEAALGADPKKGQLFM